MGSEIPSLANLSRYPHVTGERDDNPASAAAGGMRSIREIGSLITHRMSPHVLSFMIDSPLKFMLGDRYPLH